MEKVTCGIIQDLLPSYGEGLTGENVTQMIQEHLAECKECQWAYEELKKRQDEANKAEISRGKSFGNKLKRIRYYAIGFLIGLVLPVFVVVLWFVIMAVLP